MLLASRFTALYRNLGLARLEAGKLLHVTERTLRNWETGRHEIPYSAYKLLRILTRQELPGQAWSGWHITAGVLWSPEGHGFRPGDSSWWSLLCRRARLFEVLYRENGQLRAELAAAVDRAGFSPHEAAAAAPSGVTVLVTRHQILNFENISHEVKSSSAQSLGSLTSSNTPNRDQTGQERDCPAEARFVQSRLGHLLPKGGRK